MTPPLSFQFRISTYFTLLVACLTLGYSEWDLVPESILFTVAVVISLIVSFFLEGRFALGLGKANLVGLAIGIVAVVWLAVKLTQPATSALANLSWPANLLPYMGPLVMILIPAKLFRPKHAGDWWTMQGIGLATVVLASSMSDDPFFIVLVALYAAGAVWSLALFATNRSTGAIPAIPGQAALRPQLLRDASGADGERGLFRHSLVWLGFAGAIALPLFFISPRSTGERWAFTKTRLETGYNPENTHDVSKIGDLETNREIAFEVTAFAADGSLKTDLDGDQLWRGTAYTDYEMGNWLRKPYLSGHGSRIRVSQQAEPYRPPELGRDRYELAFRGGEKVGGLVVSSPLFWADDQESPVSSASNGSQVPWIAFYDGSFVVPKLTSRGAPNYSQRTRIASEAGIGSPMESNYPEGSDSADPQRAMLTNMRISKIREYSVELLKKCVLDERFPAGVIESADRRAGFFIQPEYHERVAKVFRDHFLLSGEFEYTTKLRRVDKRVDPIEDFLWNSKVGHCERFASALALTLRALGIPAQFVIGFKGFESTEDGKMLIRQEHAHAWVEVLISRPAPPDFAFQNPQNANAGRVNYWLSLDPTTGSLVTPPPSGSWFDNARQKGITFINDFIIGYNPAKRQEAVDNVRDNWLQWTLYLAGAMMVLVALIALRRHFKLGRSWVAPDAATDLTWYRRLLSGLKHRELHPAPGETPKEFADRSGAALRSVGAAAIAGVPAFVTSKLYRVRYAGTALTPAEETEILAALAALESAPDFNLSAGDR